MTILIYFSAQKYAILKYQTQCENLGKLNFKNIENSFKVFSFIQGLKG